MCVVGWEREFYHYICKDDCLNIAAFVWVSGWVSTNVRVQMGRSLPPFVYRLDMVSTNVLVQGVGGGVQYHHMCMVMYIIFYIYIFTIFPLNFFNYYYCWSNCLSLIETTEVVRKMFHVKLRKFNLVVKCLSSLSLNIKSLFNIKNI